MRSPHIIILLALFFFLSLILQTHQRTIDDQTHRIGSNVGDVSYVAVTSPEGRKRERFRVRRPMKTWRKGKMFDAREHGVPSGPNPISNR
ncbi:PREDICTED: CLAVATA3/ESR (CLE)-related protein 42-like [Camelina sativa]|uniref:CLAVATA3/ESR (CLE)-related protein 42-like n=1 Tax=Camelina sativa TaxID=90675 RepID=A0ABM1RSQ8_CAMSA|nr:PREDICTED: CLAVATA3/ESR (CLE)-related protein 42-like [Camelina sativa]